MTGGNYKVDGGMTFNEWKKGLSDEQKNALKYVANAENRGIIRAEPLSIRFVNSLDSLYNNSKMIKPI